MPKSEGADKASFLSGYRDPRPYRTAVAAATILLVAVTIVAILFDLSYLALLDEAISGLANTGERLEATDERRSFLFFLSLASFVVTAFALMTALYVLARNAKSLTRGRLANPPATLIVWFFFPGLNLFMPYLAVQKVWRASVPGVRDWQELPPSIHIKRWWAFWLLWWGLAIAYHQASNSATSLKELRSALILLLITNVLRSLTALAALNVIWRLASMQREKMQLIKLRLDGACAGCGEPFDSSLEECPVCGATAA